VQIASGQQHSLAMDEEGYVWSWGEPLGVVCRPQANGHSKVLPRRVGFAGYGRLGLGNQENK
jgi:alpha-tubulin suppressor-like RCC1 family protein